MATKPEDRYATCRALAEDVERWMADEPVTAWPEPWTRTLVRWLTRHRTGVTGVAAAVLAGVVGLSAVLAVQTRANSQLSASLTRETRANARLIDEQAKATQAREVAQAERQQAVTNLYHARVEEAAALRRARGMGYRTQVFNRLQQALQLDTPDKDSDRLRQEAVACLGDFVGLEPITWEDFPAGIRKIALTPDGEKMAIALDNGTIQLRTVSTGGVVAQLNESAVDLGIDPANRWLVTAGAKGDDQGVAGLRDSSGACRPDHRDAMLIWQGWRGTEGLRSPIRSRRMVGCFPCGTSPAGRSRRGSKSPPESP